MWGQERADACMAAGPGLSGDGITNIGPGPLPARDAAIDRGIICALPVAVRDPD